MTRLRDWISELLGDEPIEAIVFGEMGWGDYNSEYWPQYAEMPKGKPISAEAAQVWLEAEFDSGYGAPGCPAFLAYTTTRILSASQYDGSTAPFVIPRNPTDGELPEMPGG